VDCGHPLTDAGQAHVANHVVERRTFDQFHGVEVNAVLRARGVDRNDVRVMEPGGRFGFSLETLYRLRSQP
jgi:hypothetical protein